MWHDDAMTMLHRRKGIGRTMADQKSVRDVTYDLLRSLGLTTVFGNPGSTEETFLKNFPDDFTYVLGLQEASVLAMATVGDDFRGARLYVIMRIFAGRASAL
jgi:benzoylformate decarboxylase